jgi:formate hydrogenlyase transcriptional activator
MPHLHQDQETTPSLQKWNAELAFRPVVEATADKAGLEFMRALVKNLAESLRVEHTFVAEFAGNANRVRTIAFWSGDNWVSNVEYRLPGTPCEQVIAGQFCLYRDNVQQLFPADTDLVKLGVRSYLGVPLKGSHGQTLGHLAALDSRPMNEDPRGLAIFDVFANRARVEMERLHADAVLRRAFDDLEVRLESTRADLQSARRRLDLAYGELQALLEINQSATRHLRRPDLFAELARSVKPLLPCERFGIEVPTGPETLRVHVLALDRPAQGPMVEEFASAGTACRWAQEQRQWYVAASRDELRQRFPMTFAVMAREGMESLCALPLVRENRSFGALFFMSTRQGVYRDIPVTLLERVASAVAVAVDHCFAYEELAELHARLQAENVYLKEELQEAHDFREIIGQSAAIRNVLAVVPTIARAQTTVLILGETGTGKELLARAIHDRSPRRDRPLVKVNCAAMAPGLVESELFGHVRGAFTGAVTARTGRFEIANGGTIFLDEVGELPLDTQVKLLRVLQEHEFEQVGSSQVKRTDVRVIAATNRDLAAEVRAGRFRPDLYFRLNVLPIVMPPLRDRSGDIELLARYFADRFSRELGKRIEAISRASIERLAAYDWPGNIRELSNLIERAVVLAPGPVLEIGAELTSGAGATTAPPGTRHLARPADGHRPAAGSGTLDGVQRQHILDVLADTHWVIEGPAGAAARLGVKASTLRSRMKKLGIRRAQESVAAG